MVYEVHRCRHSISLLSAYSIVGVGIPFVKHQCGSSKNVFYHKSTSKIVNLVVQSRHARVSDPVLLQTSFLNCGNEAKKERETRRNKGRLSVWFSGPETASTGGI